MTLWWYRDDIPDELAPSAKFIFYVLVDRVDPLTLQQLQHETLLPGRTIRKALRSLRRHDLIEKIENPDQPSKPLYSTAL